MRLGISVAFIFHPRNSSRVPKRTRINSTQAVNVKLSIESDQFLSCGEIPLISSYLNGASEELRSIHFPLLKYDFSHAKLEQCQQFQREKFLVRFCSLLIFLLIFPHATWNLFLESYAHEWRRKVVAGWFIILFAVMALVPRIIKGLNAICRALCTCAIMHRQDVNASCSTGKALKHKFNGKLCH